MGVFQIQREYESADSRDNYGKYGQEGKLIAEASLAQFF